MWLLPPHASIEGVSDRPPEERPGGGDLPEFPAMHPDDLPDEMFLPDEVIARLSPEERQYVKGMMIAEGTRCRHCGASTGKCRARGMAHELGLVPLPHCCESCRGHHGPEAA